MNYVKILQGDGINIDSIKVILKRINDEGFSTTNIAFGQGGGSLQKIDRDTFKMAIKCSSVIVDGESRDVFKDPITDPCKKSKVGKLDLYESRDYGTLHTVVLNEGELASPLSIMRTVYENGELLIDDTFDTIRKRVV